MDQSPIPLEIMLMIAQKNVIVYVKLRECCHELRQLLTLNTTLRFQLRSTLMRNTATGKLTSRPAITYDLINKYVIKTTQVSNRIYHVKVYFDSCLKIDLRPKKLKHKKYDSWVYPDTIHYVDTELATVRKYYDREGDGLICRLIMVRYKYMPVTKWSMWYDAAYHVLEIHDNGEIFKNYIESTIPEYYPPHIKPDPVWT